MDNVVKSNIADTFLYFLKNKQISGGIAMTLVLLYHMFVMDSTISLLKIFFAGYLGVDIFFILSGYGLCYSLNNNSISSFYKRRFKKILPLYWLMSLSVLAFYSFSGKDITFRDCICNLFSLNYYKVGGFVYEWYLSALIIFYVLFPLLYRCLGSKMGGGNSAVTVCDFRLSCGFRR